MTVAIILLATFLIIAIYCAIFFLISWNEEKEYAQMLRTELREIKGLKAQLQAEKEYGQTLLRELKIEKQLRVVMQKRYISLAKEKENEKGQR